MPGQGSENTARRGEARAAVDAVAAVSRREAGCLSAAFRTVVDGLYGRGGALTGMGKSAHMTRKDNAGFKGFSCPVCCLHPGETSHGDLEMLLSGDTVSASSPSDNTAECSDRVACAIRNMLFIGVTCPADSLPDRHATRLFSLPLMPEGDALALTLMHRRGYFPETFHRCPSGDSPGRKLLTIRAFCKTARPDRNRGRCAGYVKVRADLVLKCGGGQGAFRELADRLLLERINTDLLPEKERL